MADFDVALAELNAKLAALNTVLAAHPEVAAKVATAVDGVSVDAAKVLEDKAQDDARANALKVALAQARADLTP